MATENKDISKENWERMLFAAAMLAGTDASTYAELARKDPDSLFVAIKKMAKNPQLVEVVERANELEQRISEQDVQKIVSEIAQNEGERWLKIATAKDSRVCKACAEWQGVIVSNGPNSLGYPTVDDFINSNGLHYNCRCSLQELSTQEIARKGLLWKN